jgi:hypothetical protein
MDEKVFHNLLQKSGEVMVVLESGVEVEVHNHNFVKEENTDYDGLSMLEKSEGGEEDVFFEVDDVEVVKRHY